MNKGGRDRNALNMLLGRDGRGRRGEAARQRTGGWRKKDAGREQEKVKHGSRRTGLGSAGPPAAQREERGRQCAAEGRCEVQSPAGLASRAQQNENLLTTQNC